MAIYHMHLKTFSRSQGHSSIAAAAYRAGMLLIDPATGKRHNYLMKRGVVETRCIAPADAPSWAFDPSQLWPAAEAAERRKDSTLAREFEISLPHELDDPQRKRLVTAIAGALVERYRFAVQTSIHAPDAPGSLNHHVHMLATTRRIGPEGLEDKTRELDGGPSGRAEIEWTRKMVADTINRFLEEADIEARVDHRTLEAQAESAIGRGDLATALGLLREPTVHMGKHATALERKGLHTRVGEINAAISEATEAEFDALVGDHKAECDVAQALERRHEELDRAETVGPIKAADLLAHPGDIRVVRDPTKASFDPDAPMSPALAMRLRTFPEKRAAAKAAFAEAQAIWDDGLANLTGVKLVHTARILRFQATRLRTYTGASGFVPCVRQLLRHLMHLAHAAGRLVRRKAAEARAQTLLAKARHLLEAFDELHPRPGLWSRSEWTRQRTRRAGAVKRCAEAVANAQAAINEDAQRSYDEQTRASAEALEAWSAEMLGLFPVDADEPLRSPSTPPLPEPELPPAVPADGESGSSSQTRRRRPAF